MGDQLGLFAAGDGSRPTRVGDVDIAYRPASTALAKASGFMGDYDFTLNPYIGCAYGCTYCYAASFAPPERQDDRWGDWVVVKENAVRKLRNMRTDLAGKTVYMSSVTDPYQLIERRLGLVRELLEVLADREVRLVVQTRSPLVTRDIDLFKRFEHIRVNMTVTTDSERVRRVFEPQCTPNRARLAAIGEVVTAGIPASLTMTPLLPVEDPVAFGQNLRATGVTNFVVQPFHPDRGRFTAGTRGPALKLIAELGWDRGAYERTVEALRRELPQLAEGRGGFRPA
ncbi:SPL family radical SAM protein [Actinomarinicola tropica]|uniref:SPL family radical SAM protein n=1 Tax=Actinomarinicola tropica TaxID=2789776 RepID=UPI001E3DB362|nr:radical SAM protein [Actinomarinicola tropica]